MSKSEKWNFSFLGQGGGSKMSTPEDDIEIPGMENMMEESPKNQLMNLLNRIHEKNQERRDFEDLTATLEAEK